MHKCFTVRDWIHAWTTGESGEDPLATRLPGDEVGEGVAPCDIGCASALDAGPGVPDHVVSCPQCMAACDELDEILDALEHFDPAVAAESFETDAPYEALVALPVTAQASHIATDSSFRTWGLCQRFLSDAESLWWQDRALSHARARTGVLLAEALDEDTYHPRWVADLRAKAHAYLGNCLRILARFDEAERELDTAVSYLHEGVESGHREARVLSLQASLRIDQGRLDEAGHLLDRVEGHYEATGQRTELARTQLKRATILDTRGEYRPAAKECARAFGNLDPRAESRLSILACQSAVFYLLCTGEVGRARELFSRLASTDERMVLVQRRWIEADLLRAEGRLDLAMGAYDDARRRYADENLPYDVALVALDQAVAALEMGDHQTMQELAREADVLLHEANAPTEALAMLRGLAAAIDQGTVTRAVLAAIRKRVAGSRPTY
jgi:tetratricopeptide (TPR) repeat protein